MSTEDITRWQDVLAEIRKTLRKPQYDTWFRRVRFASPGDEAVQLIVPNRFYADWLSANYRATVEEAVQRVLGFHPEVRFTVDSAACEVPVKRASTPRPAGAEATRHAHGADFERFVVGNGNRLAQAACRSVTECPGTVYNPLVIHGGRGMGKSHLLRAVCRRFSALHPDEPAAYVSAERFVSEVVNARSGSGRERVRSAYRSVSLLAFDDVHLLAAKESSQEAFFHVFNELHSQKRQVLVAGDRPPQDIPGLSERLVSRLRWGLLVGLGHPDDDTRLAILRQVTAERRLDVPPEVIAFLASKVLGNIRDLTGALVRVSAYASLSDKPLTVTLAREALSEETCASSRVICVEDVQQEVAGHFRLKVTDLVSKKRSRSVAFPRQIGMYLSRCLTDLSLGEIGKRFGKRDHTTVLYACEKIAERKKQDPALAETLREITVVLESKRDAAPGM